MQLADCNFYEWRWMLCIKELFSVMRTLSAKTHPSHITEISARGFRICVMANKFILRVRGSELKRGELGYHREIPNEASMNFVDQWERWRGVISSICGAFMLLIACSFWTHLALSSRGAPLTSTSRFPVCTPTLDCPVQYVVSARGEAAALMSISSSPWSDVRLCFQFLYFQHFAPATS